MLANMMHVNPDEPLMNEGMVITSDKHVICNIETEVPEQTVGSHIRLLPFRIQLINIPL